MINIVNRFLSTTFFALSIYLLSSPLAALLSPRDNVPLMTETGSSIEWTIDKDETIASIADAYYGDSNYWTTIWNDNPWIENPWIVEEGWVLELRNRVPKEPQVLDADLMQQLSQTMYFYYPEVQLHPALGQTTIVVDESTDPNVQAVTAEFVPPAAPVTPVPITYSGGPLNEAQITYLGQCEAGMDPAKNTGNGYYGAFQFSYGTWKSMNTGYERADMAPIDVQKDAVQRLLSRSSIHTQFPGCARKMQANGLL